MYVLISTSKLAESKTDKREKLLLLRNIAVLLLKGFISYSLANSDGLARGKGTYASQELSGAHEIILVLKPIDLKVILHANSSYSPMNRLKM